MKRIDQIGAHPGLQTWLKIESALAEKRGLFFVRKGSVQVVTLEAVKSDHAMQFRTPEPCADGKPLPFHKVEWMSISYISESLNLRLNQVGVM
jgi:hypothetical protein